MLFSIPVLFVFASLVTSSYAADCTATQRRQDSNPSGVQIAAAILGGDKLDRLCSNDWLQSKSGDVSIAVDQTKLTLNLRRSDSSKPIQHCKDAVLNIVQQCILGANFWGGTWSLDGETYTISNLGQPSNALTAAAGAAPTAFSFTTRIDGLRSDTNIVTAINGQSTTLPVHYVSSISAGVIIVQNPRNRVTASRTITTAIPGITADTSYTYSYGSQQTVVPVDYDSNSRNVIIVLPLIVDAAGNPVPILPPPNVLGLPGGPGGASPDDATVTSTTLQTTSTTSTVSSTACSAACTICPDPSVLSDDEMLGDDDLDWDLEHPDDVFATIEATATSLAIVPTPSPIDKPACYSKKLDVDLSGIDWVLPLKQESVNTKDLLYRVRQVLCSQGCFIPEGLTGGYATRWMNGQECEISIALTNSTEMYMYRSIWPAAGPDYQTIWQQCFDSTQAFINRCSLAKKTQESWWNGDHAGQFYKAGYRRVNDVESKHGATMPFSMNLADYRSKLHPIPPGRFARNARTVLDDVRDLFTTTEADVDRRDTKPGDAIANTTDLLRPVNNFKYGPKLNCPVNQVIERRYPRFAEFATYDSLRPGLARNFYHVTRTGCAPMRLAVSNSPGSLSRDGKAYYVPNPTPYVQNDPRFDSDHAFEFQILGKFFSAVAAEGHCDAVKNMANRQVPLNNVFNEGQKFGGPVRYMLQYIYDQGANIGYPDMVALDNLVNVRKGAFFRADGRWSVGGRSPSYAKLTTNIQMYGMVVALLQSDWYCEQFSVTFKRFETLFAKIDADLANDPQSQNARLPSMSWANAFRVFVKHLLDTMRANSLSRGQEAFNALPAYLARCAAPNSQCDYNRRQNEINALTVAYGPATNTHWQLDTCKLINGPKGPTTC